MTILEIEKEIDKIVADIFQVVNHTRYFVPNKTISLWYQRKNILQNQLEKLKTMKNFKYKLAITNYDQDLIDWCVGIGMDASDIKNNDWCFGRKYLKTFNRPNDNNTYLWCYHTDSDYTIDYKEHPELTKALLAAVDDNKIAHSKEYFCLCSSGLHFFINRNDDYKLTFNERKPTLDELLSDSNCKLSGKGIVSKKEKAECKDMITPDFIDCLKYAISAAIEKEKFINTQNNSVGSVISSGSVSHAKYEHTSYKDIKEYCDNFNKYVPKPDLNNDIYMLGCWDNFFKPVELMSLNDSDFERLLERVKKMNKHVKTDSIIAKICDKYKYEITEMKPNHGWILDSGIKKRAYFDRLRTERDRLKAKIDRMVGERSYSSETHSGSYLDWMIKLETLHENRRNIEKKLNKDLLSFSFDEKEFEKTINSVEFKPMRTPTNITSKIFKKDDNPPTLKFTHWNDPQKVINEEFKKISKEILKDHPNTSKEITIKCKRKDCNHYSKKKCSLSCPEFVSGGYCRSYDKVVEITIAEGSVKIKKDTADYRGIIFTLEKIREMATIPTCVCDIDIDSYFNIADGYKMSMKSVKEIYSEMLKLRK